MTFVFCQSPHITSSGREGLDALLAASAFCSEIQVVFLGEGVSHLLVDQQPEVIAGKDYISMFKLLELYEIENIWTCRHSLERLGLDKADLIIDVQVGDASQISRLLHQSQKILTF